MQMLLCHSKVIYMKSKVISSRMWCSMEQGDRRDVEPKKEGKKKKRLIGIFEQSRLLQPFPLSVFFPELFLMFFVSFGRLCRI